MKRLYSTKDHTANFSLKEAVLKGLAPDGGLFMPHELAPMDPAFFEKIHTLSLQEIGFEVAKHLLQGEIPDEELKAIVRYSLTFDAPLVRLSQKVYSLELFHGPTLSFKDFGARFMARLMSYYNRGQDRCLNILAATSGDTGSAVAHGFLDIPKIKVWILYPKGQVSAIQEKQLTAIGHNVSALEIEGTFDDCQALVKRAFNDPELFGKIRLTSANSINISRLIPQTFYYFYAYAKLPDHAQPLVFSVPSGNFGNLTAGLIAKQMGLPVQRFIAATNINDCVPKYLETGQFTPRPSIQTISNAMDVGNPSNFARILDLYGEDLERIRKDIFGARFTDEETREAIRELYARYHYIADPHGAVAYLGLRSYQQQAPACTGIFLETAHPAKFLESVQPLIDEKIELPINLQKALSAKKKALTLKNDYDALKQILEASGQ